MRMKINGLVAACILAVGMVVAEEAPAQEICHCSCVTQMGDDPLIDDIEISSEDSEKQMQYYDNRFRVSMWIPQKGYCGYGNGPFWRITDTNTKAEVGNLLGLDDKIHDVRDITYSDSTFFKGHEFKAMCECYR